MSENYNIVKTQLQEYSFEFLKNSDGLQNMFDKLNDKRPNMIINAQKPNLLAAAIVYVYLRRNRLNGMGGITAKEVGKYFGIKASAISSKASDVEFWLYGIDNDMDDEIYEFIDKDRFVVNEMYWEFIESEDADNIEKSIKRLKAIIKKDPNYFDPYITLHDYYLYANRSKDAYEILYQGYIRAMKLIVKNNKFPDRLLWGFIENRHIIRILFNFATTLWLSNKKSALSILLKLLRSNPEDNIGARYSIVGILEGFKSQEHLEECFVFKDGEYIDWQKQEEWFSKNAPKYKDVLGWWFDLEE